MLSLSLAILLAQNPAPKPVFVASTASAKPIVGTIQKLGSDFALEFAEPAATVAAGKLDALQQANLPRPPRPSGPQVRLANRDAIPMASIDGGDGTTVKLKAKLASKDEVPLTVPLASLASVWWTDPPEPTLDEPDPLAWFDPSGKRDAVLLRNGDVVRGTLERFTDTGGIVFKPASESKSRTYDATALAALATDPALSRARVPKGPYAVAILTDGTRLTIEKPELADGVVSAKMVSGSAVQWKLERLAALAIEGTGTSVRLGDLKPLESKHEPFGRTPWPMVVDRSAKGLPILLKTALGEEFFDRGLGLHSKTTLTYAIDGKYSRFEAIAGLDARSGRRGEVDLRFSVDGVEQSIPGLAKLNFSAAALPISIDIAKAKKLTIIVDYGANGDVQDDVNLADAKLFR